MFILHQNIIIMAENSTGKKKVNWLRLVIEVLTVIASFFAGANAQNFIH